jgi:hypothetical protein
MTAVERSGGVVAGAPATRKTKGGPSPLSEEIELVGIKECVRCGRKTQLNAIRFKVYGVTAVWEDSTIYCSSCIKDLGWVEVVD